MLPRLQTRADYLKWLSLAIILFQNAATPLFFRFATTEAKATDRFSPAVAVVTQEFIKLCLSFVLVFMEEGSVGAGMALAKRDILGQPMTTLKLGVPALLYFIQNQCLQLASSNLPAALFQVMYQGKTIVVAFCSIVLLQKQLSRHKWLGIALMAFGLAVVNAAKTEEKAQANMANSAEQNFTAGIFFVLVGCFCSGFAGVYFEKMMKKPSGSGAGSAAQKKPSMWVRNIQLASFSLLVGAVQLTVLGSGGATESTPMFHGFTNKVWIMVWNNAIGGLCVAFVIKYANNILKGFACAFATVLASIAAVPLFGFTLKFTFVLGMFIVLGSAFVYGGTIKLGAWWNEEPELCKSMRRSGAAVSNQPPAGNAGGDGEKLLAGGKRQAEV